MPQEIRGAGFPDPGWYHSYGGQAERRNAFMPAYLKAVAPAVAGAISLLGRDRIRLLVVGGGTGTFTRDLLPEVKRLLARQSMSPEIKVTETDISSTIEQIGGRSRVDLHNLPFDDHSFDLVVGQAVMHMGGRKRLPKRLSQIKRVLTQDGIFVHIHDSVPNPREWIGRRMQVSGSFQRQVRNPKTRFAALHPVLSKAHLNLIEQLGEDAVKRRMICWVGDAEAEVVAQKPNLAVFDDLEGIDVHRENVFKYFHGVPGVEKRDEELAAGKARLKYSAYVTMVSDHPQFTVQAIERAIGAFEE